MSKNKPIVYKWITRVCGTNGRGWKCSSLIKCRTKADARVVQRRAATEGVWDRDKKGRRRIFIAASNINKIEIIPMPVKGT